MIFLDHDEIINSENLLEAWAEFLAGKRGRLDVQRFGLKLMDNIFELRKDLADFTYKHGNYQEFNISDPKPRVIHKASVRDRLLHHAIHRQLYPVFDKKFVHDSYSCREKKGVHAALNRFRSFAYKASRNNTKTCWILQCDIRKFFANIDHDVLIKILDRQIEDKKIVMLLEKIITSFDLKGRAVGLPLGNLTSQLFVNIYMNEFDQFVKHKLKAKYYVRYADDFVILSSDKKELVSFLGPIGRFLWGELKLELHKDKIKIKTLNSGVDFLGWVHFFDHRVLRTRTRRRMIKRIGKNPAPETLNSYLGLLKHGNAYKLKKEITS